MFRYRETEPAAAVLPGGGLIGLGEGLEQSFLLRFRQADAGVPDREGQNRLTVLRGNGRRFDDDLTALGELHRVAGKVHQHLPEAQRIADEGGGHVGGDGEHEFQPLFARLVTDDGNQVVEHFIEFEFHRLQLELAGLDLGEVQDVVDDGEQQVRRRPRLGQVVALLFRELGLERKPGHADDGVERRADLVAHVGEERTLRLVGGLRGLHRELEPLRRLHAVVDVGEYDHHAAGGGRGADHVHDSPRVGRGFVALEDALPVLAHAFRGQLVRVSRAIVAARGAELHHVLHWNTDSEQLFRHGEHFAQGAVQHLDLEIRVEHQYSARHVAHRDPQQLPLLYQVLLGVLLFGDIRKRSHPSAAGNRIVSDLKNGSVRPLPFIHERLGVIELSHPASGLVLPTLFHLGKLAVFEKTVIDIFSRRPAGEKLLGQTEKLSHALVESDEARLGIKHEDALIHVLKGRLEHRRLVRQLPLRLLALGDVGFDGADANDLSFGIGDGKLVDEGGTNRAVGASRFDFLLYRFSRCEYPPVLFAYPVRVVAGEKVVDGLADEVEAIRIEPSVPALVGDQIAALRILENDRGRQVVDHGLEALLAFTQRIRKRLAGGDVRVRGDAATVGRPLTVDPVDIAVRHRQFFGGGFRHLFQARFALPGKFHRVARPVDAAGGVKFKQLPDVHASPDQVLAAPDLAVDLIPHDHSLVGIGHQYPLFHRVEDDLEAIEIPGTAFVSACWHVGHADISNFPWSNRPGGRRARL